MTQTCRLGSSAQPGRLHNFQYCPRVSTTEELGLFVPSQIRPTGPETGTQIRPEAIGNGQLSDADAEEVDRSGLEETVGEGPHVCLEPCASLGGTL